MAGAIANQSALPAKRRWLRIFTAETPLGTYRGIADQVVMSRTPGAFRTVLAPCGSCKPEWLAQREDRSR
jgi:hypothetical protein